VTVAENGKTYSAKQVASRIGTDAKQLRKFFRDKQSGYTPVGQGGRYDFPEADIPKIKAAFDTWNATKTRRNRQSTPEKKLMVNPAVPLIPGQRKDSPTPRVKRTKDNKEGLHGNALDDDTLHDRMQGIAARVKKHHLTIKQGRLVPMQPSPDEGLITTPEEAQPRELDFTKVNEKYEGPTDEEIFSLMSDDTDVE
jgi:hypothetical protein